MLHSCTKPVWCMRLNDNPTFPSTAAPTEPATTTITNITTPLAPNALTQPIQFQFPKWSSTSTSPAAASARISSVLPRPLLPCTSASRLTARKASDGNPRRDRRDRIRRPGRKQQRRQQGHAADPRRQRRRGKVYPVRLSHVWEGGMKMVGGGLTGRREFLASAEKEEAKAKH